MLQHPFLQSNLYAQPVRFESLTRPCLLERPTTEQKEDGSVVGTWKSVYLWLMSWTGIRF